MTLSSDTSCDAHNSGMKHPTMRACIVISMCWVGLGSLACAIPFSRVRAAEDPLGVKNKQLCKKELLQNSMQHRLKVKDTVV